jgi:hypothetical protein
MDLRSLCDARLEDLLLQGFTDEEKGGLRFYPMLGALFLKVEGRLIRMQSTEQYSAVELSEVQTVAPTFEVDPGTQFCVSSADELLLLNPMGDNRIECVEVYGRRSAGEIDQFDAIGLRLYAGQYLFFDPSFLFGMKVGGERQRESWLRNVVNATSRWEVIRADTVR